MSTTPTIPLPTASAEPPHYFADLYTFKWSDLAFELPLISTSAVALCLIIGLLAGHPGGALVSAGGAFTVGFGANQRIADSRLLPMLFAVFAMASATLIGSLVGHNGYTLILASAASAAIYGILTMRNSGLAWVGQQASVALFVATAFASGPKPAFERAGLIVAGGMLQVLITSMGLRILPELRHNLTAIPRSLYESLYVQRRDLFQRLRSLEDLDSVIPAPDRTATLIYALRLTVTVGLASELYRRLGIQSGYWIPMTALLVQKPAFFETLNRGLARVAGTLAGATLATLLAAHLHLNPWTLAALAAFFAFWCFATNSVNYGLFSVCITSYIVFLLSLNALPGPEIAHRRALCTAAGALIALLIHLDALRRHHAKLTQT